MKEADGQQQKTTLLSFTVNLPGPRVTQKDRDAEEFSTADGLWASLGNIVLIVNGCDMKRPHPLWAALFPR